MTQIDSAMEGVISLAEAAKRYGLSHAYLRRIAGSGRLKAKKVGHDWVTTPAEVEAYLASRKKRGAYRAGIQKS
jgi:hypothetical protein